MNKLKFERKMNMAHYIEISNLGPIEHCKLDIKELNVLTGPQASGKSTIAKAVYFFRTIKDDVFRLMLEQSEVEEGALAQRLFTKFTSLFGKFSTLHADMSVKYFYEKENPHAFIEVTTKNRWDETKNQSSGSYMEKR